MKKSNVYTKKGDQGMTSLVGGERVQKTDVRVEAYGTVDELNTYLGWLSTKDVPAKDLALIHIIQHQLFSLGSYLATAHTSTTPVDKEIVCEQSIAAIETAIDEADNMLPPLSQFILPGASESSALCHVCRTVCRRAERRILTLNTISPIDDVVLAYMNRLSDYLFVLSRKIVFVEKKEEFFWNKTCI